MIFKIKRIVRKIVRVIKPLPPRANWYWSLGVTMPDNVLFLDVDSHDFDIYKTKDGIHLVANLGENKFDYRFNKLRISPKYEEISGEIASPAPELFFCNCSNGIHIDKRLKGELKPYVTYTS